MIIRVIYFLGIFGLLIHMIGTHILTLKNQKIISLHKGYLNVPCILYSCSLFIFIKENSFLLSKFINKTFINKIGSLTLGPFFLHLPVIDFSHKYFKFNEYSLNYRLIGGIVICIICFIITFLLRKIPLI